MRNLDSFLTQWRRTLSSVPQLTPETIDELESHLRERIEELIQSGIPEADACQRAAAELGSSQTIGAEFRKLDSLSWLPVKLVTGVGVVIMIALASIFLLRRSSGNFGADVLLMVHVFTVTVGFASTILLGLLGGCFVLQRAYADFSSRRLASLSRVTVGFASVATVCTALGIILGIFWTHREWGRFWGWDAKEIGALCVLVWMCGFLIAHTIRRVTTRGLLVASVL